MTNDTNILSFDEVRSRKGTSSVRGSGAHTARRSTSNGRHPSTSTSFTTSLDPEGRYADYGSHSSRSTGRPAVRSRDIKSTYTPSRFNNDGWRSASQPLNTEHSTSRFGSYTSASVDDERTFKASSHASRGSSSYEDRVEHTTRSSSRYQSEAGRNQQERSSSLKDKAVRQMRSAKAERQFDRTIGAQERRSAEAKRDQGSSRAAVYEMRMGRTQKRSSRMQDSGSSSSGPSGILSSVAGGVASFATSPVWMRRFGVGVFVILLFALFVYQPLANYYHEVRNLQQMQVQYDAVSEVYQQVVADAETLSTDQGMADYAHEQLGWVRSGEHAVSVSGVSEQKTDSNTTSAQILSSMSADNFKAPDTWYSGVLDVVFGYED